jgi:hypothetical protein
MANLARLFFALWYLGGCLIHLYNGLTGWDGYRIFGETMLLPQSRELWAKVVMPRIRLFALLLAAFELATGLLILAKGRAVKLGLAASILFNLYLVQQGLGSPRTNRMSDFLINRLVNLVFAAAQVPLFRVRYDETFWVSARRIVRRRTSEGA